MVQIIQMQKKLALIGNEAFLSRLENHFKDFEVYKSTIPGILTSLLTNVKFDFILSEFPLPNPVRPYGAFQDP